MRIGGPRGADGLELDGRPRRVLFICEDAIGDLLLTLPAIRAIAESSPGTTVDLLTSEYAVDLVRELPYIRDTIVFPRYDRRRVRAGLAMLRRGRYDAVVDGMVLRTHVRTRSVALMLGARAAVWIGEAGRPNDHVYSLPVAPAAVGTTHSARMMRLAEPFLNHGAAPTLRARLVITKLEQARATTAWAATNATGRRIVVNLSASCPERRWPDEKFAAVLDRVRARRDRAAIIVVGLPRDAASVEALAARVGAHGIVPTLRELIALVASADLVLSPDTAVCHMASAFERTLISLNLADHEVWAPYDTPGERVIGPSAETLDGLEADAVIRALDAVLTLPRAQHQSVDAAG
ncbi:MAG: hypothetical protein JWM41_315 [Gemmatimonadetes bacterium]|nr:hypothetical protein [Gemmatimonadota bacterium]